MRKLSVVLLLLVVLVLSGCSEDANQNNFSDRQDGTFINDDKTIMIEYKTDASGKMIEMNIDHLLTIEQMILLNPTIDFDIEVTGAVGNIFVEPNNSCVDYSFDLKIPSNIEVGNTRYKFDNSECMYKTIDNHNEFKAGYADEYLVKDTIPESKNTTISIIAYTPDELIPFTEIYELPNSYDRLGVYNIMFNMDLDGFRFNLVNYYFDMSLYEQLYLKNQENELTILEISGISDDVNIMDLNNLLEVTPLIDNFEDIYEEEINAIEELQQSDLGIGFGSSTEETDEEPIEEETE